MNIFYIEENDIILDINTEKITENYKEIKGENIDEIISILSKEKLSYDTDIQSKLEEIFENNDKIEKTESYKIKHWVSNRSFGELVDMYENNEILVPNMQREFVWDSTKSSRLIESNYRTSNSTIVFIGNRK